MISLLLFISYFYNNLQTKYQELISYLIVGVLTTIVSIASYYIFRLFINSYIVCTIISWIIAIIFAYITNRLFVFKSKEKNIIKEFVSFIISRLASLGIELLCMALFVDFLSIEDKVAKIIVQVFIIVLNYIFSKLFVFKRKD